MANPTILPAPIALAAQPAVGAHRKATTGLVSSVVSFEEKEDLT